MHEGMDHYIARSAVPEEGGAPIWHYTVTKKGVTRPVGGCARRCKGHSTRQEAQEHYKQYLLDQAEYNRPVNQWEEPCECCGEETLLAAVIRETSDSHTLCELHQNRGSLDRVMPCPVERYSSYLVTARKRWRR